MKRGLLAAAAVFAAAAGAGCLWLASLFSEPGAAEVPSLAGALGAQRVLGVFAHPDDEQLVTGLLLRAGACPTCRSTSWSHASRRPCGATGPISW